MNRLLLGTLTVTDDVCLLQILSMIEEAVGTRLYESKKETAQKTIEKKDAKLKEIDTVSAHFSKHWKIYVI